MEVKIYQEGKETVIKIIGRLDTNTSREFEKKLLSVWQNPAEEAEKGKAVCVDCSDLEYVSSAGLRLFLVMQKMSAAESGSLRLVDMRDEVREIFNVTGFNAIFKIECTK